MVTFTCQNCNSCLKKKAVEVHLYKCKNPLLTCIDCLKDFDQRSYAGHVTCVTEDQRYGGRGFVASNSMVKQDLWNSCVVHVSKSANVTVPNLKAILQYAANYPTCPRNKKKFLNFILNNKPFSNSKNLAEKAYDMISEEFSKVNLVNQNEDVTKTDQKDNGNEDVSDSTKGGKRKTISETEIQIEPNKNGITKDKMSSKKKNKKIDCDADQTNHVSENGDIHKKKNKNKNKVNKPEKESDESSSRSNGHIDENSTAKQDDHKDDIDGSIKKKKGKDKRKKSISYQGNNKENTEADDSKENESDDCVITEEVTVVDSKNEGLSDILLSKKEKKKLLKQKKYEAEIESIENFKREDENPEEVQVEPEEKRKKKKKKGVDEDGNRQQKNSISEPEDKKIKLEGNEVVNELIEIEKPKKFKWDEVIIQVLQNQGDCEMSLKRLSKKVIAEYANVYGERESYEEVALKFNKKVLRTPGVRVFKDRAKLLSDS